MNHSLEQTGRVTEDPDVDSSLDQASDLSGLHAQLMQLGPADHEALARILAEYPAQQNQILQLVASRMGNAAVQRALTILRGTPEPHFGDGIMPSRGNAESQARAAESMQDFWEENSAPASKSEAKPAAAPSAAQRYNAAHQHFVDEFNSLTDGACVGPDGTVDPQLVAKWQGEHGLVADGMVGPQTVAAAHHAAEAKQSEAPKAPNIEEIAEELE
jgi:hypothetical protein